MSFYSIYIPSKTSVETNDEPFVFTKKEEALKVLKNHKDARLKIFKNNEDAINYAQTGNEMIIQKYSDLKSPGNLEKSKFHAPTKQELIQFRKAIEEDKYDLVKTLIYEDPRYLVNSADRPTSLKDGPRYNALHICAIHKKAKIASLILETISDVLYIEYLHDRTNSKINQEVSNVLLDYYLNMPEKGRSETPLHLASKYGAVEVIEVLTSYPQCKMVPNLDNLLPRDIVCSRMNDPSPELKEKILSIFEERFDLRFYVPVIRSVDNSIPPTIGEPFSPKNPPELNKDPMSPELKIQAYAGPLKSKEEAQKFRRRWKTPPRNGVSSPVASSPFISPMKRNSSTPTKSINNNNLNETFPNNNTDRSSIKKNLNFENIENDNSSIEVTNEKFPFPTLTPLLKNPKRKDLFFTYRDKVASPVIFDDNDSFSSDSNWERSNDDTIPMINSPGLKERHLKLMDTEKGFEIIGRELAKEQNIGWKEYWDFLDTFIDISSEDGLNKLEKYLEERFNALKIEEDGNHFKSKEKIDNKKNKFSKTTTISSTAPTTMTTAIKMSANNFQTSASNTSSDSVGNVLQTTTPYLCVEKSLQVFAKRMTKTILNNMDSVVSINDSFTSELKRLKSLVCSFRDDIRFLDIDFNVIHSRFANLIVNFLNEELKTDKNSLQKVKDCFKKIIQSRKKCQNFDRGNYMTDRKEQLQCISEMILDYLENSENKMQSENIKTEQDCLGIWREELKCNCNWNSEMSRPKSIRRRRLVGYLDNIESQSKEKIQANEDKTPDSDENCSSDGDDETDKAEDTDEEDTFWSDMGSNFDENEDEKFYTPPQSPTQLDSSSTEKVFLMENVPTKRDWDVVKALHNIEIDKTIYPNIYNWRKAVLEYPIEERVNFPSPIMERKQFFTELSSLEFKQRLFLTPVSKGKKQTTTEKNENNNELYNSYTNPSSSEIDFLNRGEFSTNLSLLNVSES